MSRYIDIENAKLKGISIFDQNLDVLVSLSDVRKSLQMTPTADVQEVRHGKWKLDRFGNAWCSLCHHCGNNDAEVSDYCPNCGAKMDE